jgi:hypothetical protein
MVVADIEGGPWPLAGRRFDAVVVTNYLWRPLLAADPGRQRGRRRLLIYETFADGQQTVGRPSRPDFLLQPGELIAACAGLRVVAYEDGFLATPTASCSAWRRCGRRQAAGPWLTPPPPPGGTRAHPGPAAKIRRFDKASA